MGCRGAGAAGVRGQRRTHLCLIQQRVDPAVVGAHAAQRAQMAQHARNHAGHAGDRLLQVMAGGGIWVAAASADVCGGGCGGDVGSAGHGARGRPLAADAPRQGQAKGPGGTAPGHPPNTRPSTEEKNAARTHKSKPPSRHTSRVRAPTDPTHQEQHALQPLGLVHVLSVAGHLVEGAAHQLDGVECQLLADLREQTGGARQRPGSRLTQM